MNALPASSPETLARLFALVGLYTNYFQPVLQTDLQAALWSQNSKALRPAPNSLPAPARSSRVAEKVKERLRASRSKLDPLFLLSEIRAAQSALATLASPEERSKVQRDDLSQFLARLSHLWPEGDANPTRRSQA